MKYRSEIDGLRGIAVLSVILFHANIQFFHGGYLGVDIFFVISGYLITTIIINEIQNNNFNLSAFYIKRARRLLPALFLVVIVTFIFSWFLMLPSQMKELSQSLVAVTVFLSNFFFNLKSGYFDETSEFKPLIHTWSLGVEEQFYIFFPILIILLQGYKKKIIFFIFLTLCMLSLFFSELTIKYFKLSNFYFPHTRIWELLIGSILSLVINKFGIIKNSILSFIGLIIIFLSIYYFDKETNVPGIITLFPILGISMIILHTDSNTLTSKILSFKILSAIGIISYSIYLWHQPVFVLGRIYFDNQEDYLTTIILFLLIFSLSYLSWRFVEIPFRRNLIIKNINFIRIFVSLSFIFIVIGFTGHFNKGNFLRWDKSIVEFEKNREIYNKFVWEKKNQINLKKFKTTNKKILIVGDSNSGDLINALSNTKDNYNIELSSIKINSGCGNLYINKKKFEEKVIKSCLNSENLFSHEVDVLMNQADLIIFASAWKNWEVDLVNKSYNNLITKYGNKFIFFGNKDLIFPSTKILYSTGKLKINQTYKIKEQPKRINNKLKKILGNIFIDPYDFFCSENICNIFNKKGQLLIYDGFHLTLYGAKFFGEKLEKNHKYLFSN